MKYKLSYSEAAQDDLQESYDWYEDKRASLGEEFLEEVEQQLELVQDNPESFGFYDKNYRSCNVKKFPFKIIFAIDEDVIKVWAIYHHKRNPKKWKR